MKTQNEIISDLIINSKPYNTLFNKIMYLNKKNHIFNNFTLKSKQIILKKEFKSLYKFLYKLNFNFFEIKCDAENNPPNVIFSFIVIFKYEVTDETSTLDFTLHKT